MAIKYPQQQPIQLGPSGQSQVGGLGSLLMQTGAGAREPDVTSMAQSIIGALLSKQAERKAEEKRAANAADFSTVLNIFGSGTPTNVRSAAGAGEGSPPGSLAPVAAGDQRFNVTAPGGEGIYTQDMTPGVQPGGSAAMMAGLKEVGNNPALMEALGPTIMQFIAAENAPAEQLTGKDRFIVVDGQLVDMTPSGGRSPTVVVKKGDKGIDPTTMMQNVAASLGYASPADAQRENQTGFEAAMETQLARSGIDFNVDLGDQNLSPTEMRQKAITEFKTEDEIALRKMVKKSARTARENRLIIQQQRKLVEQSPGTGFGSKAAQFFKKAVFAVDKNLLTEEERGTIGKMEALTSGNIHIALKIFAAMTKGAITDTETALFMQAAPGMTNTQPGNLLILDMIDAGMSRTIDKERFMREWDKTIGNGTLMGVDSEGRGFEEAWAAHAGSFMQPFEDRLTALSSAAITGDAAPIMNRDFSAQPPTAQENLMLKDAREALQRGAPLEKILEIIGGQGFGREWLEGMPGG